MTSIFVQSHVDQQFAPSAVNNQLSQRETSAIERISSSISSEQYLKEIENLKKQVRYSGTIMTFL